MQLAIFKNSMKEASKRLKSNIVFALDVVDSDRAALSRKCIDLLEAVSPHICALKLNRPLVLRLCLEREIKYLLERAHDSGLMTIMDAKLNDVAHTNLATAKQFFDAGFDALIASPFVGWDGGLDSVFREAVTRGKGVILLVHMSHKGAGEGYGQTVIDANTGKERTQYTIFAEKALAWDADGAVVGATHPKEIALTCAILRGKVPIYSPGIVVQGGSAEQAIKAGADYLIVGRAIYESANPQESARSIQEQAFSFLRLD